MCKLLDPGDLVVRRDAGADRMDLFVVGPVEIGAAGADEAVLLTQGDALGAVFGAVAGVIDLDAVHHSLFHQLPQQRHTLVHGGVGKHDDSPRRLGRGQHFLHRNIFRRVEHDAPRVPAEQVVVGLAVDAVGQPQFPQRLHDAAFVKHAAVLGVFQRLFGAELGVDGLDLPCALQAALVPALAHEIAVAAQGRALRVGPEGQQMHPVLALVVVAGQLGGWDELYAVLCGVVVTVLDAEQRVMVGDGHSIQPHPRCEDGQTLDGDRAIGTGRVVVQIAGHFLSSKKAQKAFVSKGRMLFGLFLVFVEIDKAAVGQNLTFIGRQRCHIEGKGLDFLPQHIGRDVLQIPLEHRTDVRDEDVIPQPEGRCPGQLEGQHPPVDEVGAVALGGVLHRDIRPSPQHALAGRRLFAGGAVAGLDREDGRRKLDIVPRQLFTAGHSVNFFQQGGVSIPGAAGGFLGLNGLGAAHVGRVLAAEGELGQTQGVGTVRGRLAGGNELVGGGHRVGDVGRHLQQQIVPQRSDLRPILDVGAELEQRVVVAVAKALIHAGVVAGSIVVVLRHGGVIVDGGGRGQDAAVGRGGRNAAGIHQSHAGKLAAAGLGTLTAGEVAGGVADGQRPVGGYIARAETGAAEGGADGGTAGHQVGEDTGAGQFHHDGLAAGVNAEGVVAAAAGMALEDGGGLIDAVEQTARAARNDALIDPELSVFDLAAQIQLDVLPAHELLDVLLTVVEDVAEVGVQLLDGEGIRGVHRQRDHRADLRKIHAHHAVIIGKVCGSQGLVVPCPAMDREEGLGLLVCLPDGGQAGGLGGHGVDGVAGILPQGGDAGADEFHHLVLDVAALEQLAHQGDGHIVGAAAGGQRAGQVDGHHTGAGHIIGASQKLLCQLAAALADGHGAQRAVAGVGVGAEDHLAAAREPLPHILVDDGEVGRHKDAAVFLRGGQAEAVVILVDGAAHRAQTVVAVGEHIRDGELFQTRRASRLDDADERDVVAGHGVELDLQVLVVTAGIVCRQDAIGHGALVGLCRSGGVNPLCGQRRRGVCIRLNPLAAQIVCAARAAFDRFQHIPSPLSIRLGAFSRLSLRMPRSRRPLHRGPALPTGFSIARAKGKEKHFSRLNCESKRQKSHLFAFKNQQNSSFRFWPVPKHPKIRSRSSW